MTKPEELPIEGLKKLIDAYGSGRYIWDDDACIDTACEWLRKFIDDDRWQAQEAKEKPKAKHWTVYKYKDDGLQWPFRASETAKKYVADEIRAGEPYRVILFRRTHRGLEVCSEDTIYVIKEES